MDTATGPQPDPREHISLAYDLTLASTTRFGSVLTALLILAFMLWYWLADYPRPLLWVNLAGLLVVLAGCAIAYRLERYPLAAHLTIVGAYVSVVGSILYTGGIESTSIMWLVAIPVAAAMMPGLHAALLWGGICLATIGTMFLLNAVFLVDLTLRPPGALDHLMDVAAVTAAMTLASWFNEKVKRGMIADLAAAQHVLHQQARLDPLTEAHNRRSLEEQTTHHLTRRPNSILVFDIDYFKAINDTHGHAVGDQVLRQFSLLCRRNLRQGDILARMGGDEFAIFLPDTDLSAAQSIAERLRRELASTVVETTSGDIQVTSSIGLASHSRQAMIELEALFRAADRALYRAKRDGRNRVCVAETV